MERHNQLARLTVRGQCFRKIAESGAGAQSLINPLLNLASADTHSPITPASSTGRCNTI